jgi:hypothetical protein
VRPGYVRLDDLRARVAAGIAALDERPTAELLDLLVPEAAA